MWLPITSEDRRNRWPFVAMGWFGLGLLVVWDPVANPGPSLCGMRWMVALPCPLCGMTRGVSRIIRADPSGATYHNPLSLPTFAVLMTLLLLWTSEVLIGRRLEMRVPRVLIWTGWMVLAMVLVANWAYMIAYRCEDDFKWSWLGRLLGMVG